MRAQLHYLLLDGFDPDTGELGLRVRVDSELPGETRFLRLKLHLGRSGDPLQPLRRELQTHVQMPIPPLWDRGLKIVIRAIEDELATPSTSRKAWPVESSPVASQRGPGRSSRSSASSNCASRTDRDTQPNPDRKFSNRVAQRTPCSRLR